MADLDHEDRRALRIHREASLLAECGLAHLGLDVMRLRLTPSEARRLVGRLCLIQARLAEDRAERMRQSSSLTAGVDAVERHERRRRRG